MFSKEILLESMQILYEFFAFADFEANLDADSALFSIYLDQFAASGIDVSNINSGLELLNALNAACDLLKVAILMEA